MRQLVGPAMRIGKWGSKVIFQRGPGGPPGSPPWGPGPGGPGARRGGREGGAGTAIAAQRHGPPPAAGTRPPQSPGPEMYEVSRRLNLLRPGIGSEGCLQLKYQTRNPGLVLPTRYTLD